MVHCLFGGWIVGRGERGPDRRHQVGRNAAADRKPVMGACDLRFSQVRMRMCRERAWISIMSQWELGDFHFKSWVPEAGMVKSEADVCCDAFGPDRQAMYSNEEAMTSHDGERRPPVMVVSFFSGGCCSMQCWATQVPSPLRLR